MPTPTSSGHRRVRGRPAAVRRDPQRARARHHERDAVAELVGRGHRALHERRRGLDAPRVHGDVLGRGAEGDEQRERRDGAEVSHRVHVRHVGEADRDARLRDQHPAAATAEQATEDRQLQPVHHRRPEDLDRVDDADPGQHADRRPLDARLAQPRRERREDQHERQARGEPEEQHREHAGIAVRADGGEPAAPPGTARGRFRLCRSAPPRRQARSQAVVDHERRVVGEPLRLVDAGARDAAAQPRAHHLVVDAPAHVLRPGLAAVGPPRVLLGPRVHLAERVDEARIAEELRPSRRAPRAGIPSSSGWSASSSGRFPCARCSSRRRARSRGCLRASERRCGMNSARKRNLACCRSSLDEPEGRYTDTTLRPLKRASM